MSKIVVLGASGQLGQMICHKQKELSGSNFDFFSSKELDVTNKKQLFEKLDKGKYTNCIITICC